MIAIAAVKSVDRQHYQGGNVIATSASSLAAQPISK
jgi:hypothetical protein